MKSIIAGMLCLLLYHFAQSQEPLIIGSKMPDLEIKNIANYPSSSVRINELTGKAIIFYFWGVRCLTCVQNMPKLAEFRKKFGDRLALFMVTEEADDVLQKFFDKRTYLKELKLPSINNQLILRKLFPLDGVPHVIWISPGGFIKAITGGMFLTDTNIEKLIQGKQFSLPVKILGKTFDFKQPLVRGTGSDSFILASSVFTGQVEGVKTRRRFIYAPDKIRFVQINSSPLDLYIQAYRNEIDLDSRVDQKTRIVLEHDKTLSMHSKDYCYEISLPVSGDSEKDISRIRRVMRTDLDVFFNFQSTMETRRLPCYFVEIDSTSFQQSDSSYREEVIDGVFYSKQPTIKVVTAIKWEIPFDRQVIPGNSLGKFLTVLIKYRYEDLEAFKADLAQYGLRLVEGEVEMKVLVLRSNNE